jgi:hypothetical protein
MPKPTTDYVAVILVGGGSAWGRHSKKETAIKTALEVYKKDWGKVFVIRKGDEVVVNVIDVHPHNEVNWDHQGWWAKVGDGYEKLERKIEHVHRSVL